MTTQFEGKPRYFLLLLILLVLIGAIYFLLPPRDYSALPPARVPAESQSGERPLAAAHSGAAVSSANTENITEPTVKPAAASSAVPAWQRNNTGSAAVALPEGVVIYESVTIDMDSPVFPEPGERVALELPEGVLVNATVISSNENPNGDYSWRGYLDGYGTDYPVVMTYSANSVFATVTTPKGSYTLVSVSGSGWIYKNPSEFELSQPGVEDHMEIPHQHK